MLTQVYTRQQAAPAAPPAAAPLQQARPPYHAAAQPQRKAALDPTTEAALRKAFSEFDADRSGTITAKELKALVLRMGQTPSDQQVAEMLVAMGAIISLEQFTKVTYIHGARV